MNLRKLIITLINSSIGFSLVINNENINKREEKTNNIDKNLNQTIPKNQIFIDNDFAKIDLYNLYHFEKLSETEIKSMEVLFYGGETQDCVNELFSLGKDFNAKECRVEGKVKLTTPVLLKTCAKTQSALYYNNILKYIIFSRCLKNDEGKLCSEVEKTPKENYFKCSNKCFIDPVRNLNNIYEINDYDEQNLEHIKSVDDMLILKKNMKKIVNFCEDSNANLTFQNETEKANSLDNSNQTSLSKEEVDSGSNTPTKFLYNSLNTLFFAIILFLLK